MGWLQGCVDAVIIGKLGFVTGAQCDYQELYNGLFRVE